MPQIGKKFETTITKKLEMNYLLYLPEGYGVGGEKWPLVVFLHGAGERGDDVELVKTNALPNLAETEDFPFIAVSPQCPEGRYWPHMGDELAALIEKIIAEYNVDTKRIYLTGISMGGYGTWHFIQKHPHAFAAAVPVCGGADTKFELGEKIGHLPLWVFHGALDRVVPLSESLEPVKALTDSGGDAKMTIYGDVYHDSWTETFKNPELYEWLLSKVNEGFTL